MSQGCEKPHGRANPLKLVIACKCNDCDGDLRSDSINATGTIGVLICSLCGCAYEIGANKEIRR